MSSVRTTQATLRPFAAALTGLLLAAAPVAAAEDPGRLSVEPRPRGPFGG